MSLEQMTASNLDASRVAGEVIAAARPRLDEITEDELRRTCEQIIRTFYRQFLASPEAGAQLALAGVKELLTRIPSAQVACSDPLRMPTKWVGASFRMPMSSGDCDDVWLLRRDRRAADLVSGGKELLIAGSVDAVSVLAASTQ